MSVGTHGDALPDAERPSFCRANSFFLVSIRCLRQGVIYKCRVSLDLSAVAYHLITRPTFFLIAPLPIGGLENRWRRTDLLDSTVCNTSNIAWPKNVSSSGFLVVSIKHFFFLSSFFGPFVRVDIRRPNIEGSKAHIHSIVCYHKLKIFDTRLLTRRWRKWCRCLSKRITGQINWRWEEVFQHKLLFSRFFSLLLVRCECAPTNKSDLFCPAFFADNYWILSVLQSP